MKLAAIQGGSAGNLDPRQAMVRLAERLEGAHEQDPGNAAVARELRAVLLTLAAGPDGRRMDAVDRIRAEWEALNGPGV